MKIVPSFAESLKLSHRDPRPRARAATKSVISRRIPACRRRIALVTVVLVNALLGITQDTMAAVEDQEWHFGYDLLQMLFEERGLRAGLALEEALSNPERSVVVMTGDTAHRFSATQWGKLVQFVRDGGSLLLASDRSSYGPGFGQIPGELVTTRNPRDQYQGFEDCLRITPGQEISELSGVTQLVTNRSSWFIPSFGTGLSWEPAASLPGDCLPASSRQRPLIAMGYPSERSAGLAIVCADASVFTNGMLWHGDNAIAAIRVSERLCGRGRKQLVFIVDGNVRNSYRERFAAAQSGDPDPAASGRELPKPELTTALTLANAIAKEVAESNVLNEALRQQPRNVKPSAYLQAVLAFVAGLFVIGILWISLVGGTPRPRLVARQRMAPAYEFNPSVVSDQGDYRDPAGQLAREFCFELTGSRHTADWQRFLSTSQSGGSPLDRTEQQKLAKIIDIACRGSHESMTRHGLEMLGKSMSVIRARYS